MNTNDLLNKANRFLTMGKYQNASQVALEALQLDPTNPRTIATMGDIALAKQNPSAAIFSYEQAYKLDPTDGKIGIKLASTYLDNKETTKAKTTLKSIPNNTPEYLEAQLLLAENFQTEEEATQTLADIVGKSGIIMNIEDKLTAIYCFGIVQRASQQLEKLYKDNPEEQKIYESITQDTSKLIMDKINET